MSAEVVGRDQFLRDAERIAADVEKGSRAVANATAERVATGVRSRVRTALRARLRAAVKVIEEAGARQFHVGFDDVALFSAGLFPMVPVWHEFGTNKMTANPAVGDALAAERQRYVNEMEQAIGSVLEKASSR